VRNYQLVSADSHLEAPPVWAERLPADLRDKAPQIVYREDGDGMILNGQFIPATGLALTAGHKYSEIRPDHRRYTEEHGASTDPSVRIKEQDTDGVDGEGLFPAVANILNRFEDPRLIVESSRAYNDWLSEYCSYAPDRLFGLAVMPFTGVDDAIAELRRVVKKPGIRAIWLLRFPSGGPIASPEDDRFWAECVDQNVTVTSHHNFGGGTDHSRAAMGLPDNLSQFAWLLTCDMMLPTIPMVTILQLMLSGVMDRFPTLRFFFAESGIGWVPYWLEQMDDRYERHRHWPNVKLDRLPSQYFRDQVMLSFQEDHVGIRMRDVMLNNIAWASDFPHAVSDWPWSQEVAAREMRGIPDEDRRRIQALNILEWHRIITKEEKEELAKKPVQESAPAELAPRLARRM
jgi:predicted TIM-barrel fold metal-dependent hydrolase